MRRSPPAAASGFHKDGRFPAWPLNSYHGQITAGSGDPHPWSASFRRPGRYRYTSLLLSDSGIHRISGARQNDTFLLPEKIQSSLQDLFRSALHPTIPDRKALYPEDPLPFQAWTVNVHPNETPADSHPVPISASSLTDLKKVLSPVHGCKVSVLQNNLLWCQIRTLPQTGKNVGSRYARGYRYPPH